MDKRAEEERRASEWVEHFVDTADLSEKERKAIAFYRDKEANDTSVKFSSTARRAMEKLKQAGTDEKFRESPQGPAASECAYGQIPAAERSAAVLFDQLRRTPWFVRAIADWRNSPEWKDVQAFLDNGRAAKRFPLAILRQHWPEPFARYRQAAHDRDPVLRRRFEAAVEMALTFSEWPAMGYCQLAARERRKRLEEFGWTFGAEPFWEVTKPIFEIFVEAAAETQQSIRSLADVREFLRKSPKAANEIYLSTHLVEVDWRYPMETIIASFRRWAAKQPKRDLHRITQAGRPATTNLVGFACIRLIDDFGLSLDQAMSWLKERYGGRIPKTPERLERALKATRDALKDFLPSPAEIGV
jgi:hypothetical protein